MNWFAAARLGLVDLAAGESEGEAVPTGEKLHGTVGFDRVAAWVAEDAVGVGEAVVEMQVISMCVYGSDFDEVSGRDAGGSVEHDEDGAGIEFVKDETGAVAEGA